jgi:NAD(P)H-dependent FMN reductase
MLKIALIIGSTRPNRFADKPAQWMADGAKSRRDFRLTTLDLRDFNLPFFAEPLSPMFTNGTFTHPAGEAWRKRIGEFDGYIMTAAEYNHGPTAVLKNALDYAYYEWNNKPVGFVGYGGMGATRAVEQLRLIAIELQMAPIKNAVHISLGPFLAALQGQANLESFDQLNKARTALFDQLVWWAGALKGAREVALAAE